MLFQTNSSPNYIFTYEIKRTKIHTTQKIINALTNPYFSYSIAKVNATTQHQVQAKDGKHAMVLHSPTGVIHQVEQFKAFLVSGSKTSEAHFTGEHSKTRPDPNRGAISVGLWDMYKHRMP